MGGEGDQYIPEYVFTQKPGPTNYPTMLTPLSAFLLLFPEVLFTHIIITDTICYAAGHEELKMVGTVTAKEMYTHILLSC